MHSVGMRTTTAEDTPGEEPRTGTIHRQATATLNPQPA